MGRSFLLVLVGFSLLVSENAFSEEDPHVSQSPSEVESLGRFESIRATEEHVYGYVVELWRESGKVFGLFAHFEGPPEPTSRSLFAPVQLGDSGELKFSTHGNSYRYSFTGSLHQGELEGVLDSSVIGRGDLPVKSESLSFGKGEATYWGIPVDYAAWRNKWERILE